MIKSLIGVFLCLVLFGCDDRKVDKCLQRDIFSNCIRNVSNLVIKLDGAEIIRQCNSIAREQATRNIEYVKSECQ